MRPSSLRTPVTALTLLLATACGQGSASGLPVVAEGTTASSSPPPVLQLDLGDGTTLFVNPTRSESTSDAAVGGELVVIQDECVGLDQGDRTYVLLFSYGTEVGPDGSIIAPSGQAFQIGDSVEGAGGYYDFGENDFGTNLANTFPACYAAGGMAYVSGLRHDTAAR